MTDNEKRAHDLAVQIAMKHAPMNQKGRTFVDGKLVPTVDYFAEYFVAYSALLKKMDEIFSDSQEK